MNEYTNTRIAASRNAELVAKARKARPTSKNAVASAKPSWFSRLARPLTLADVR